MQDAAIIEIIRGKYIELLDDLDERGRRRWAAVEARAPGRGGIAALAPAPRLSDRTIRTRFEGPGAHAPGPAGAPRPVDRADGARVADESVALDDQEYLPLGRGVAGAGIPSERDV